MVDDVVEMPRRCGQYSRSFVDRRGHDYENGKVSVDTHRCFHDVLRMLLPIDGVGISGFDFFGLVARAAPFDCEILELVVGMKNCDQ